MRGQTSARWSTRARDRPRVGRRPPRAQLTQGQASVDLFRAMQGYSGTARDGHVSESPQPVGADRKHSRKSTRPGRSRQLICAYERLVAEDRLDSRPHVSCSNARVQHAPRLERSRCGFPGLTHHLSAADDATPCLCAALLRTRFERPHTLIKPRHEFVRIAELCGDHQGCFDDRRHCSIRPEEVTGTSCAQPRSGDERAIPVDPRPVVHALDEVILHWVRCNVDKLHKYVVRIRQTYDARLPGCPKVLPATAERILTARKQLVKVLDEFGIATATIEDSDVVVV